MSDNYRKIHISLTEENYQLVRKLAFDAETTKSDVINVLIQENPSNCEEPPVSSSTQRPEVPSQPVPMTWSVNSLGKR